VHQLPQDDSFVQRIYQIAHIHSKHGRILRCDFECLNSTLEISQLLHSFGLSLKDQKYAFVQQSDLGEMAHAVDTHNVLADVWHWLQVEMAS
jgi:hypothetical protein